MSGFGHCQRRAGTKFPHAEHRHTGGSQLNEIIALAIHDLVKTDASYSLGLADELLPVSGAAERVINTIYELYNRRTSKSHGRFTEIEGSPTQAQVRDYIEGDAKDFLGLTARMMANLAVEAGKKAASEGGHVFFAHFRREGSDYLLVTIVTDKLSAALAKGTITDVTTLDLDGFRFAGRINLTGWAQKQDRYLSFLQGKGMIADYFRDFLGCDSAAYERVDTRRLVEALQTFTVAQSMEDTAATAFLNEAKDYLSRANKLKEPVEFKAMANRLMPNSPEKLSDFLADTDRGLSEGFVPNASAIKQLVRISGETKMWAVEFTREAIDKSVVSFDAKTNSLTLREVPAELVERMRAQGMIGV